MLKAIKRTVHNYSLKKAIKESERQRSFVNATNAKFVGILFNANKDENLGIIKSYVSDLRRSGKDVQLLGYKDSFDKSEILTFPVIQNKDLNWYNMPSSPYVNGFVKEEFDILINAYLDECLPLEYISAKSFAKFRVGKYTANKTYCYDMMININFNKDLKQFLNQIKHFTGSIKTEPVPSKEYVL